MLLTFIVFGAMSFAGYFTFYEQIDASVLDNYPRTSVPALVGRIFVIISIALSVPYMCFMPRLSIYAFLAICCGGFLSRHKLSYHVGGTLFILFLSTGIAVSVSDLGLTYQLVGAVSSVGLAYILPPLAYLVLEKGPIYSARKLLRLLFLLFGIFVMVGGTVSVIYQGVEGAHSKK